MNRSRLLFVLVSLIVVAPVLSAALFGSPSRRSAGGDSLFRFLGVFHEVLSIVNRAYVEDVEMGMLLQGALEGSAAALDPFSTYVPAARVEAFEASREIGLRHSGLLILKERGIGYVSAVIEGGPAAQLGIEPGDVVSEINGVSTRALPLWEVQEMLAAEPGTKVELELVRRGESMERTLTLASFESPQAHLRTIDGVGVLRIPALAEGTAAAVRRLLSEAPGDRLILDLRRTALGPAAAAYSVAELFVAGELGSLRSRETVLEGFEARADPLWTGELVILVDRGSVGAAEVLAAVLKQGQGARLVGERSFGHAGRQEMVRLSSGARLLLTTAFYTGPDGEPIRASLEPDVVVDARTRPLREVDEEPEDRVLQEALELFSEAAAA